MAEREKKPLVPDWAVKLILGGSAIAVGGYVVYYYLSGGALADAAKREIEDWTNEYARELKKIIDEGRVPTQAEEYALQKKLERIEAAYSQLHSLAQQAPTILITIAGMVAGVWLVHKLARDYWETHVKHVRTAHAAIQLLREAHAIDLYAGGQTSLAIALHTQTEAMFTSLYIPLMQSEVAYWTNLLPTLTGTRLIFAQFLIQSLQIEISATIPAMMAAAASILSAPPPPIPLT